MKYLYTKVACPHCGTHREIAIIKRHEFDIKKCSSCERHFAVEIDVKINTKVGKIKIEY